MRLALGTKVGCRVVRQTNTDDSDAHLVEERTRLWTLTWPRQSHMSQSFHYCQLGFQQSFNSCEYLSVLTDCQLRLSGLLALLSSYCALRN